MMNVKTMVKLGVAGLIVVGAMVAAPALMETLL